MKKKMDIYTTAWRKGVKSTYYLHMKPRHTAEQSTVAVNKSEKLGKTGFASVFRQAQTNADLTQTDAETKIEPVVEIVQEEVIEKEHIMDKKTTEALSGPFALPLEQVKVEPVKIVVEPLKQTSEPIFSKVQTQLEPAHKEGEHFKVKIVDGKTYKVHAMPTDPQEKFMCDGCQ